MSESALRVLGFAMRTLPALPTGDGENVEFSMTFVGVVGMIDPPRQEVAQSVRAWPAGRDPHHYDHRRP